MTYAELTAQIPRKQSFLCVGLDPDLKKIPSHLKGKQNAVVEFNRSIVEATADVAVAYKPNLAFYEAMGTIGWEALKATANFIHERYPDTLLIADAKRSDIGNTAEKYAKSVFEDMPFDAVTLSPYMGSDTIKPFLAYPKKWVIVLALTSNPSASDLQTQGVPPFYKRVLYTASKWADKERLMFVAGATHPRMLAEIREIVPHHFLLVPGIGAQGGSLEKLAEAGLNKNAGLLVNASRSIIYAGNKSNYAEKARQSAYRLQQQMQHLLLRADIT